MSAYLFGSSYYPEWWPEEEWKKDFAKMADLGLNAVRMGEFAWSWYEPREGEFCFEPMQRAVEMAARGHPDDHVYDHRGLSSVAL